MVSSFERETQRNRPSVREALRREELHDAYRAGRTSFKFSVLRGLEYTGTEADNIDEYWRRF